MNRSGNIFHCLGALLLLAAGAGRAETVFWSDNFETNTPSRWTTSSVWRIGSPTAGPGTNSAGFRTHSGTNCASTQNYAYNSDTRLICTNYNGASSFVVPPTNQFPRLRFWHWFNFANALGYVEISTNNGGSWNQISPTYPPNLPNPNDTTSGGERSRPSIDLSAFAGRSVQIAFHFTSGGCCGNAQGWYVDDVAVVTDTPVFNNPKDFESGLGDWSVDFGTWEIGKPTSGPNAAHTGTNCAATILAGNYANNVDTRLISPPFAVPTNSSPSLRFWHWYNFNNALGFVEITTDGSTWNQISPTYLNGNTGGAWINVSLNLSAYAGQTVQTAFHFTSGGTGTAVGWYVDDISLIASPTLTIPPTQTIYAGQTLTVTNYATLFPAGTPIFGLVSAPTNVVLTMNGVLTWTPAIAQTPSTNTISVKVTDNNVPPFSATNSFVVQVLLSPPVLTVPPTQTIYGGQTLTVTNSATNSIFPNCTFTFGIVSAPTNVVLTTNGVLTWTPTIAQVPSTNTISVKVTDNNVPPFSETNSFVVQVLLPPALTIAAGAHLINGSVQVTFNTLSNVTWRIDVSTNLLSSSWLPLFTNTASPSGTIQFTDLLATNYSWRFYRAVLQ